MDEFELKAIAQEYKGWSAVVRLARITGKHNQFEAWIPGAEFDAHKTDPQRSVLIFDPDFSKEPHVSPISGLICYPTRQTTPIRYIMDEYKLPGFVKISEVHRGFFYMPVGSCVVVGIQVQRWKWLAVDDLRNMYHDFRKNNNLQALHIAGHDGVEIDLSSISSFDRMLTKVAKVSIKCANQTSMSGLFYLENSNYLQYAGDDVEIQMYPVGFHNKYAQLDNDQKSQVFRSRKLFIGFDPEYLQCFEDFSFEQQMVCRLVACGDILGNASSKCCYKTNCNKTCKSKVCCYKRECINTPDIYNVLLQDWSNTLDKEMENSSSVRAINEAFAKTNGGYADINTIVEKLLTHFDRKHIMIVQLSCLDQNSDIVKNIKKFHHELYSICYKSIMLYAFEKFKFKNRAVVDAEIFEGWLVGLKAGKSSTELIAFIKRQIYQEKAQTRVRPMYDAALDAWKSIIEPKAKETSKSKHKKPKSSKPANRKK